MQNKQIGKATQKLLYVIILYNKNSTQKALTTETANQYTDFSNKPKLQREIT